MVERSQVVQQPGAERLSRAERWRLSHLADHVKRVLAGIDPNRADNCGVCLTRHGVLLVLCKNPKIDPASPSGREHGRSIPFATFQRRVRAFRSLQ